MWRRPARSTVLLCWQALYKVESRVRRCLPEFGGLVGALKKHTTITVWGDAGTEPLGLCQHSREDGWMGHSNFLHAWIRHTGARGLPSTFNFGINRHGDSSVQAPHAKPV